MRPPVGLVECHDASRSDQRCRLGDDLLRLRHVDKHQPGSRAVERASRQTGSPRVTVENFHVVQVAVGDQLPGEADGLLTSLHADDVTRRPNELGENVEATLRAASNLDDTLTFGEPDAGKEPTRFMRELLRLASKALLLSLPVAKEILIRLSHDDSPSCGLDARAAQRRGVERPAIHTMRKL